MLQDLPAVHSKPFLLSLLHNVSGTVDFDLQYWSSFMRQLADWLSYLQNTYKCNPVLVGFHLHLHSAETLSLCFNAELYFRFFSLGLNGF